MSNIIDITKPDYAKRFKYGFLLTCVVGITGWTYSSYCSECGFGGGIVKEKLTCLTCSGTKKMSCPKIVKKSNPFYACSNGKINVTCSKCNGTGRGRFFGDCGKCNKGKVLDDCKQCDGKGKIMVDVLCDQCKGKGEIECSKCDGKGYIYLREKPCPKCKRKIHGDTTITKGL